MLLTSENKAASHLQAQLLLRKWWFDVSVRWNAEREDEMTSRGTCKSSRRLAGEEEEEEEGEEGDDRLTA